MSESRADHSMDEQLDKLIFANRKLEGIQLLKRHRSLDLKTATAAFASRYRQLRADFPDNFKCSDAEYWQGFDS